MHFPLVRFPFRQEENEVLPVTSTKTSLSGKKADNETLTQAVFNLKSELVDIYTHHTKPTVHLSYV